MVNKGEISRKTAGRGPKKREKLKLYTDTVTDTRV